MGKPKILEDVDNLKSQLAEKVNQVSPIQYGAIGDGVADDSNYVQTAFTNASINHFIFDGMNKTYYIKKTLFIPSNSIVKNANFVFDDSLVVFSNNVFNTSAFVLSDNMTNNGTLWSANNVVIENCKFTYNTGNSQLSERVFDCIRLRKCNNVIIRDCAIIGNGDDTHAIVGIDINKGNTNILIDNCDININSIMAGGCIVIRNVLVAMDSEYIKSNNIVVRRCKLQTTSRDEIMSVADYGSPIEDVLIENNRYYRPSNSQYGFMQTIYCGDGLGGAVDANLFTTYPITIKNIRVINNTFIKDLTQQVTNDEVVRIGVKGSSYDLHMEDIVISNNHIEGNLSNAIVYSNTTYNTIIADNFMKNSGTASTSYAIDISKQQGLNVKNNKAIGFLDCVRRDNSSPYDTYTFYDSNNELVNTFNNTFGIKYMTKNSLDYYSNMFHAITFNKLHVYTKRFTATASGLTSVTLDKSIKYPCYIGFQRIYNASQTGLTEPTVYYANSTTIQVNNENAVGVEGYLIVIGYDSNVS